MDEDRERRRCPRCRFIHYRNPSVGVAVIIWESAVVDLLGEERTRAGLLDQAWTPASTTAPAPRSGPPSPRVLLARRALTYRGQWCFPCGFVEFDEDIREAAAREGREETGLELQIGPLLAAHSNFHLPDAQSVGIWFEGAPIGGVFQPGDDVDGLGFFELETAIETVPLAFPTDRVVLSELCDRVSRDENAT